MKQPLLAILILIGAAYAAVANADESKLLGLWQGNGRASEAIYGTIRISKTEISWGENIHNPKCKTTYKLVAEYTDNTYPENTFRLVPGRTFSIYKLKLKAKPCTWRDGYFQFAIPSNNNGYAEVVIYKANERQSGWLTFSKIGGQSGSKKN